MNGSLSDLEFVGALVAELAAGRSVGLASLLATRGSMPRHAGARLAVTEDGRALGTVGGGAIELIATARAREALAGGEPSIEWVTSGRSEMACGGDALLAVRALGPDDLPALRELEGALGRCEPVAVEEGWRDVAAPSLRVTPPAHPTNVGWDEGRALYREPVLAPSRLHVFGAGHVGSALVPIAAAVGFEVLVYDDRPELANARNLPAATSVTCGSFDDLASGAAIGPRDFVVVLTHGHVADELVLKHVLTRDVEPAYVGCIGSRRKSALAREHLVAAGVPRARVDAVSMPIGIAIGAVTPPEIALAIAAQLVRARAALRGEGPGKGEGA